jgi:type IV pilus assembly protein PilP
MKCAKGRAMILALSLILAFSGGIPFTPCDAFAQQTPSAQVPSEETPLTSQTSELLQPEPSEATEELSPEEMLALKKRHLEALLSDAFHYHPRGMLNPFVPFITPGTTAPEFAPMDEGTLPPGPQRPLTPLQKMSLGEIERGLRAILLGEMGKRALVEDAAGKGYIVQVGTLMGKNDGVVVDILPDRLVIQERFWDSDARDWSYKTASVWLKKEETAKQ